MHKTIGAYSFEKKSSNDHYWESGEISIGRMPLWIEIHNEIVDLPEVENLLQSITAEYINQKVASSYSELYAVSKEFAIWDAEFISNGLVYIPQFIPTILYFESLSEVTILFSTANTPYAGERVPLMWSITYTNGQITEVRWETC